MRIRSRLCKFLGLETENKKLRCDLNKIQQNRLMGNETIQNNDQSRAECNSTMDTRRNLKEDQVRVLNRRIMELERTSTFNNYRKAPIPLFEGKPNENVNNWIFLLESRFTADKIPDEERVGLAMGYLRELPLEVYKRMCRRGNPTWDELKNELKATFLPFGVQMKLRNDLLTLKQIGDNFDGYLREFNRLINQVDEMSEADKILFFTTGLRRNSSLEVQRCQPKSLEEAMKIASSYEMRYSRPVITSQKMNTSKEGQKNDNAKANKPTDKNDKRKETKDAMQCYYCKEIGHVKKNCPKKDKKSNEQNNWGPKKTGLMANSFGSDKLITVEGTVSGINSHFVLDTGANVSIMSKHFADKHKIKIDKKQVTLHVANENPTSSIGCTSELKVNIHGVTSSLVFMVISLPSEYDILLGIDWFTMNRATIDPGERTLTFKPRTKIYKPTQNSNLL